MSWAGTNLALLDGMGWRRPVRWAAIAAAIVAVAYLVGMNLFLRTRLFRNVISSSPREMLVDYRSAYSLIPGRIHVEDLAIRGRDSHVEWILHIDRCDFHISFLDFVHERFHASHVRGDGLSLRVRLRVGEATPDHLAALPPVPGFSDPPLKNIGPPDPPLTDAEYNLWSIQLDDVVAEHVRELWIDTMRYSGDFRVAGRWLFRPVRWLEVGPAKVDVRTLDISYGTRPLVTGLEGGFLATVHPFDVRAPVGLEVLAYVSTNMDLRGTFLVAASLDTFVESRVLELTRGEGPLAVRLILDHGVLQPGTHLDAKVPDSRGTAQDVSFATSLRTSLDVVIDPEGRRTAVVDADASGLSVVEQGATVHAASVVANLTSHDVDLSNKKVFDDATFALTVRGVESPSLGPWFPRSRTLALRSGRATADGHLEGSIAGKSGHGEVAFSVDRVAVDAGGDRHLAANVSGKIAMKEVSLRAERIDLGPSTVELRDASGDLRGVALWTPSVVLHAMGKYRWDAGEGDLGPSEVVVRDVVLRLARDRTGLSATASSLTASTSGVTFREGRPRGSVSIDLPRAEIADIAGLQGGLSLPKGIAVEGGRVSVSARADVDLPSFSASCDGELIARALRARVGSRALDGELDVKLRLRAHDGATDLDGTTLAFDSKAPMESPSTEGWWTHVDLVTAEVRLAGGARFRGKLHVTAKDASPAIALIAEESSIPRWVLDAVPMNGFDGSCELRLLPDRFEVRSLVARGHMDQVELEYVKIKDAKEWALLVEAGAIHAGFHDDGDRSQFVLFGVRPWFEGKVAGIKSRQQSAF